MFIIVVVQLFPFEHVCLRSRYSVTSLVYLFILQSSSNGSTCYNIVYAKYDVNNSNNDKSRAVMTTNQFKKAIEQLLVTHVVLCKFKYTSGVNSIQHSLLVKEATIP
jgi:hypothetical protein